MMKENRWYDCLCCGYNFSKEKGLEYGEKTTYIRNGKEVTRRTIACPMCGAPKKYCETYLK